MIGAGGGKLLDAARAVAADLDLPVVNCPTIASSDAPCSALSVIYSEDGMVEDYRVYARNPDLVLVDTSVIAQAPARYLVAGMGDALATMLEARTCVEGRVKNMRGGGSTQSALALAQLCYRTLIADGLEAKQAVEAHAVTPAMERIVEANTLLSGLGFESSGLAAAHSIHNGLTVVEQTHPYLHGEKVAFGSLTQLVLEGKPRGQIEELLTFSPPKSGFRSRWRRSGSQTARTKSSKRSPSDPFPGKKRFTTSRSMSTPRWSPMPFGRRTRSGRA